MHINLWSLKNEFNSHTYSMLIYLIIITLASISFTICLTTNPLSLGLTILRIALLLAITFATYLSSWFGFLIFLIYVGGILVIFAYFVTITPNQELFIITNIIIILISVTILFIIKIIKSIQYTLQQIISQLNLIYTTSYTPILIILALLLLITIVIVVKIVIITKGPIRSFI